MQWCTHGVWLNLWTFPTYDRLKVDIFQGKKKNLKSIQPEFLGYVSNCTNKSDFFNTDNWRYKRFSTLMKLLMCLIHRYITGMQFRSGCMTFLYPSTWPFCTRRALQDRMEQNPARWCRMWLIGCYIADNYAHSSCMIFLYSDRVFIETIYFL